MQHDGWVFIRIQKGMPGLKQAARLANERLVHHLAPHGYAPVPHTPSLWCHFTYDTAFALVVDDFGIRASSQLAVDHLMPALRDKYIITVGTSGSRYVGFNLDWNYSLRHVTLSMPDYVIHALHRLQLDLPHRSCQSPHRYNKPTYGAKVQLAPTPDDTPLPLPAATKKLIQQIIGIFLYYALALDLTMLVALGTLASQQANPTTSTWNDIVWFFNYAATYPNASIRYTHSDMILFVSSDGSYLSEPSSHSRFGGILYLGNKSTPPNLPPQATIFFKAPVHVVAKILKMITSSAMETEVAATFYNTKDALPFHLILAELGHPQPPSPIEVDNESTIGFLKSSMKQKHSKTIDMRFYWVKDSIAQQQFLVYWRPGSDNLADYVSKHNSPWHHKRMRTKCFANALCSNTLHSLTEHYLLQAFSSLQWGCDKTRMGPRTLCSRPRHHIPEINRNCRDMCFSYTAVFT